jgi:LuxR family quorum sensing-dependent transcriptional regulator
MNRASFAFDLIEKMNRADSPEGLLAHLATGAAEFGYQSCGIASIPGGLKDFDQYVYVRQWPHGWFERYVERNYFAHDPVIRRIRSSVRPFAWSEAPYDAEREPIAHAVMTEATEFQLNEGFNVPIYTLSGELATVTFGGDRPEICERDRAALHLIAIYAHLRVREVVKTYSETMELQKPLTPREIEVIKWYADGKSFRDIGDILSISDNTVETHIANVRRKLGVVTSTQAVARAIRARLIP